MAYYYKYNGWHIPDYMRTGIEDYLNNGARPGNFLYSVLCNNFIGAVQYADSENIENLPAYAYWLTNKVLFFAWGSEEKVEEWIKNKKLNKEK